MGEGLRIFGAMKIMHNFRSVRLGVKRSGVKIEFFERVVVPKEITNVVSKVKTSEQRQEGLLQTTPIRLVEEQHNLDVTEVKFPRNSFLEGDDCIFKIN